MTYIPATGISVFDAEFIQVDVTSGISLAEDTAEVITSAANGASLNAAGNYGTAIGWDATNNRPYAIIDGRFLITVDVEFDIVHSAASDIITNATIRKNTSDVVEATEKTYVGGGTGMSRRMSITRIVSANANDYFRLQVLANQVTGAATSRALSAGSQSASYMQVLYLGS